MFSVILIPLFSGLNFHNHNLAESQPFGLISAIWLSPNKLLIICLPDIWLSSRLKELTWLPCFLTQPASLRFIAWTYKLPSRI